jgi:hypothetical protein
MAKMKLSESTFKLIPEGIHTFKVMEVDDSKYEDFGKLEVKLQTSKGDTHVERFTLLKANGDLNEGALKAWSYFARTCLNNFSADEIDTQDIVGCYITATVKHETYTRTKGDNAGKEGTNVKLNDYTVATKFGGKDLDELYDEEADNAIAEDDDLDDLDNFLDD